ncbi:MAG TPA: M23 family metallopeptidase [Firmicutes bacterium]|jgi:murein DD-endopeptidase MepM/ murein hydrolase activator NlpD|nr:M23 family metallopeptidase [Candidatus Fermentithermobacillaceae bacterium]
MSWRSDLRERTRVIGRAGRTIGRGIRSGAERELHSIRALPQWVKETIACLFIFALVFGASHAHKGLALRVTDFARTAVTSDITFEEVKTFAMGLPGKLRDLASLDLKNFWSRAVTGTPTELAWPVSGEVTSYFGWRPNPESPGMSLHQGIDIAAPKGTKVATVLDGVVASVRESPQYGLVVEIDHGGGVSTIYGHLDTALIEENQKLNRGDHIGTVGDSGNATGSHLHFEVRKDGIEVDPMTLLPPLVKGP